ncbi:MAG: phosphoribosyl-AMP cyclohydrolase [Burkholderiales bacterium]|jgi:phosphoribosyl-AMP cyclohydrolase
MSTPATGGEAVAAGSAPAAWLDAVRWDEAGLVCAVAQDAATARVLMVAWMDREALAETAATGRAVYYSRSRRRLWRKGEESGHTQAVREIRLDCDGDVIVLQVEQAGGIACHTGRPSCFFSRLDGDRWTVVDAVLKDPAAIYAAPAPTPEDPT